MLPFLLVAADGREHRHADVFEALRQSLELSDEDLKELLPSGVQPKFENRVRWAKWYLTRAGLLERTGHGSFRISRRGRDALAASPARIDVKYLQQYPEFAELSKTAGDDAASDGGDGATNPEETLAATYAGLRAVLARELLDHLKAGSPQFFERVVVDLLVAMGYGGSRHDAARAVGQVGDGGIDGVIKEDKLGLDVVLLQAKRWDVPVGRPVVQAFAGSLEGQRARKGVLITTSSFTKDALEYVTLIEKRIVLIGGAELAELMIDHGVGVAEVEIYRVKRIDEDYFEGAPVAMVEE